MYVTPASLQASLFRGVQICHLPNLGDRMFLRHTHLFENERGQHLSKTLGSLVLSWHFSRYATVKLGIAPKRMLETYVGSQLGHV